MLRQGITLVRFLVQDRKPPKCLLFWPGVREFLGIPYAKPPVGELRFAPPQKHEPWKEPFMADKFGPGCIQTPYAPGLIRQAPPTVEDEDCVRLPYVELM